MVDLWVQSLICLLIVGSGLPELTTLPWALPEPSSLSAGISHTFQFVNIMPSQD